MKKTENWKLEKQSPADIELLIEKKTFGDLVLTMAPKLSQYIYEVCRQRNPRKRTFPDPQGTECNGCLKQ